MPNENVRFEEKLSLVQKQFLCGVPLVHFNWNSLLDDLCWERQSFLIDKTVDFDLVRKYPLKIDYQKAFVKFLIDRLLRKGNEIHDRVYEAFGRIVALPSSDFDNYKHYLNSGNVITIKENSKIISEGTTGLCTWQASLVLSEWCLSNKSALQDKNVLELGSGVGLAGISIALNCSPSKIYLSDCHKSVLEALRENVLINSSRFDELRNKIEIVELNWEEIDEEFLISTPNIDLVVCADVVYDRDLFEPLINAFCVFLQTNTKKIILACTERNRETLRSFLDKLEKNRIKCLGLEAPEQKTFVWDTSAPETEQTQFKMGERRGTKGLELWCKKMTEGYPGVKIENMTTSWRDGLGFCAIIHHFRPDLIDFSKLNKDDVYTNNELAFKIAERHLGIPALLEPEDMVELNVPDRLSILTYLSQFYQAFAVSQGSQSRILPKRPAPTTEHGIVSPASTSPPTKMTITCGIARREPCSKCGLPVFIAERLNVGKQLYHRTCFCCARCNSQLTLANYYETENNEFCCEMCPDEEPSVDLEKSVLNRSLSDEEKSAGLKKYEETDNYSAIFETALENPENETLMKKYTLSRELSDDFSAARSTFMQSQLSLNHSDSSDEEPPELPKNKPPDTIKSSENVCDDYQDVINSENSSFPHEKLVHSVSSDSDSNQHVTASTELERTNNFVTKETETNDDNEDSDKNSEDGAISVKSRILLFDNKSPEKKPVEKSELNKISNDEEPVIEEIKTVTEDTSCEDSKCDDPKSNEESVESVITISDESKNVDSPNVITDDSAQLVHSVIVEKPKRTQEYSKDLNPFGDDLSDDEEPVETNLKKSRSLNPFDEDDFEDEVVEKPKPALRKKVKAQMRYEEKTGDTPDHLEKTYVQRISENPFEKPENMPQPIPSIKKISAPKISLNPFWSDGEEPPDDEENEEKPTPLPRNAKTTAEKPEPKPRDLGLSVSNRSTFGSNASLSSTSFENVTIRKKKPAPKPPVSKESFQQLESPLSSLNASPNRSLPHSPKSTPKIRKNKKAPPPPQPPHQLSSTPFIKSNNEDDLKSFSDISPIGENWRNEKTAKDELNRNRQSQYSSSGISPTSSDSSSLSMQNKSTYGKWKRRKGPAPARPVPQRRIVKALSIMEIRRELDIIEIQQQGLEKQGVRLEQIIRERCEGPNANEDDSFSPEVEDMVLQLFDLVNEKNELFRKQAELMYLRRQHRLEEEHADVEYQIRCLMLKSETSKTDSDKAREEELINRLVEIVERRNEIIECLEMDRVREAEEDNSIKNQLNKYSLKRDIDKSTILKKLKKEKKKHKKEKRFKLKSGQKVDMDKDVDECETSSESPVKQQQEKKKKKFKIF